jgi:hypothetical protein
VRPTLDGVIEVISGTAGGVSGADDYTSVVDHPALAEIVGAFSAYRVIGVGFKLETTESFTTNKGVAFVGEEYPIQVYPRDPTSSYDGDYIMSLPGAYSAPAKQGITATVPISGLALASMTLASGEKVFTQFNPDGWIPVGFAPNSGYGPGPNSLFAGDLVSAIALALEGLEDSATFDLITCIVWEGTPKSKFQPSKLPVSPVHISNAKDVHHKKKHHAKKSWLSNDIFGHFGKAKHIFGDVWDGAKNVVNIAERFPAAADVAAIVKDAMDVGESAYEALELFT